MSKDVRQVRKSIRERKRIRDRSVQHKQKQVIHPHTFLPTDEERHGVYAELPNSNISFFSGFPTNMVVKAVLSIALFLGVAIVSKTESGQFLKLRQWTSSSLNEEFPFAKVNQWYQDRFGSPLAFSPTSKSTARNVLDFSLPVNGDVMESFHANGTGIRIAAEHDTPVSALKQGIVIFAGNDRKTGKTVIIQHPDQSNTIYGYLSEIDVHLYQYVAANEYIGEFIPDKNNSTVYFAIEKDHEYVDPIQVIQVDQQ
ncbi:M23 family metallopeptidase [Ornithinibacillus gellani]|uniref:M23 family metallopeptidase n=1 Tax=Ornithinibacillus gellani TaxID=2293253 RepID=UPI000F4609E4|nr:M23 family metallopeptidase [Ornithinibacillus gellani]TQS74681.1 M23 family metallopeptidase [Ornithinibacillus gellani]